MSQKTFSATEVKNRFGRVLRDLSIMGGPIIVEKDHKPVAVILSIDEYERMAFPRPLSLEQAQSVENGFGLWANRPELDDEWLADGRSLWHSNWQDE